MKKKILALFPQKRPNQKMTPSMILQDPRKKALFRNKHVLFFKDSHYLRYHN